MTIYLKIRGKYGVLTDQEDWVVTAYQYCYIYIDGDDEEMRTSLPRCENGEGEGEGGKYDLIPHEKHWKLPYEKKDGNGKLISGVAGISMTAGSITIGFDKVDGSKFTKELFVRPSLFSFDDFKTMAQNVGLMALNFKSFTQCTLPLNTGKTAENARKWGVQQRQQQTHLLDQLDKLEHCVHVIDENMQAIERSPCKDMHITAGQIPINRSILAQHLIQQKINPSKKIVMGNKISYGCAASPENRWLKRLIHIELDQYIKIFEKTMSLIEEQHFSLAHQANTYQETYKPRIMVLKRAMERIKQHDFLREIEIAHSQIKPTTRLLTRNGYSHIHAESCKIFTQDIAKSIELVHQVTESYGKGFLDNISNIYEIWCLFSIYNALINIGFLPSGPDLADRIKLKNDQLHLTKGTTVKLEKPFSNSKIIITIEYEPSLQRKHQNNCTPDIKISIHAPKKIYGLTDFTIILDAKHKDFRLDRNDYSLVRSHNKKDYVKNVGVVSEVMGVAMDKYHKQLVTSPQASYIIHPNEDSRFHWLGAEPFIDFMTSKEIMTHETFNRVSNAFLLTDEYTSFVSHNFAALPMRIGNIAQDIRRLFTLMFHYHMGLTSLCLGCGRELCEENEFFVNSLDLDDKRTKTEQKNNPKKGEFQDKDWTNTNPTTAFRAVCKCNNEWRVSFCSPKNQKVNHVIFPDKTNRIIKIGKLDSDQQWFPVHQYNNLDGTTSCPRCGYTLPNPIKGNVGHSIF